MAKSESTAKILSFDEFLTANEAVEYATVSVGGGNVRIGSITGDEFVEWTEMRESGAPGAKKNASSLLIVKSLVDETGARIGDPAKVDRLRKTNLKATETILKAIFKLNGINQRDEVVAKNE